MTEIGHCRDCQYWHFPTTHTGRFGQLPAGEWGNCDLAEGTGGEPRHPASLLFAAEHEDYRAHLLTQPEFGCVLFVRRATAARPD